MFFALPSSPHLVVRILIVTEESSTELDFLLLFLLFFLLFLSLSIAAGSSSSAAAAASASAASGGIFSVSLSMQASEEGCPVRLNLVARCGDELGDVLGRDLKTGVLEDESGESRAHLIVLLFVVENGCHFVQ